MKNIILIIIAVFSGLLTANGQVSFKPGIRGGVNFSKLTQMNTDYKTDFYAGIYGRLNIGKAYSLQPEITYSEQGASNVALDYFDFNTNQQIQTNAELDFSYISFALINKFNLQGGLNFQFGPTFDIEAYSHRFSNSTVDLAFVVGFGYRITNSFEIEARLKKGLVDVFDSDYYGGAFFENYSRINTNFLFQVGLSYNFTLLKS